MVRGVFLQEKGHQIADILPLIYVKTRKSRCENTLDLEVDLVDLQNTLDWS